jgi:hypothetical protein
LCLIMHDLQGVGAWLVFPRESHFVVPGKAGMQILFTGNSWDLGKWFLINKTWKRSLSKK